MRITRIYQPVALRSGASIELDERASHHLAHVLRLRPGAALRVFDGQGHEFDADIAAVNKRGVGVKIGANVESMPESPLLTVLAQGVSRGERMDYTVQKAVELGVTRIVPLHAEHTVVQLAGERRERRAAHWRQVAIGACEQCGRSRVPEIDEIQELRAWLGGAGDGLKLVLHHRAAVGLAQLPASTARVTLLVGPEGGLSDAEVQQAIAAGFVAVRLGPRVLRTETAGIAALAAIQVRWGDLA
jgi:16S rRNA (uracil1498-N3)-methyltransferase